jgi:hypothetical protein
MKRRKLSELDDERWSAVVLWTCAMIEAVDSIEDGPVLGCLHLVWGPRYCRAMLNLAAANDHLHRLWERKRA